MKNYKGKMRNLGIIQRIGSLFQLNGFAFGLILLCSVAQAGEIQLSASVDRNQMSLDDLVQMRLEVSSNEDTPQGEPTFRAPDFAVVQSYSSSSFVSQYDGNTNSLNVQKKLQIVKVLKPLKTGDTKISHIQLEFKGKVYKAADISIHVDTPSVNSKKSNQTSPLSPSPLQGPQSNTSDEDQQSEEPDAFIKAELNKKLAYKGEQVLISYYLYHRIKIYNSQVEKYPSLDGFLREDLELPILSQSVNSDQVTLHGVPYERNLLARYAAYPLKEGKLPIDTMGIRYHYYPKSHRQGFLNQDDDPIFNFFQQLSPRVGSLKTEPVDIEVLSLPQAGKPQVFTGGVGEYQLSSSLDRTEVRVNEAVNLTIKVEGQGNVAALDLPKQKWPDDIEMYESKGKFLPGKGGFGAKVFELVLIPRKSGQVEIPPVEFGFFDPTKKEYYVKATQPVTLRVLDSIIQSNSPSLPSASEQRLANRSTSPSNPVSQELRPLKAPTLSSADRYPEVLSKFLFFACVAMLGFLGSLITFDFFKKSLKFEKKNQKAIQHKIKDLRLSAQSSEKMSWGEICHIYETMHDLLLEIIDHFFNLGSKALSRAQLENALVKDSGISSEVWTRMSRILEYTEQVQFASFGKETLEVTARKEISNWITELENLSKVLQQAAKADGIARYSQEASLYSSTRD